MGRIMGMGVRGAYTPNDHLTEAEAGCFGILVLLIVVAAFAGDGKSGL
jgi:hypothetical protein